ncbi:MAG: NAD(P)-dependent oxidoreductase [Magnetococcales bacterium]|nr:NAD(P)-dependent oxidoreductase [Magnetococcales bacterium]
MAKIIITGICGFIGRHVAHALVARGDEVHGIDLADATALPASVIMHRADLADLEACRQPLTDVDGIIHLAGISRVSEARAHPERTLRANILGSAHLFQIAAAQKNKPWIILGSTREVELLHQRGQPRSLQELYAISKSTMESLAFSFARESGNALLVLRLSDVYGDPGDPSKKLFPTLIRRAREHLPLTIDPSSHGVQFYFTHIDDVVRSVIEGCHRLATAAAPIYALQRVWDCKHPTGSLELARMITAIGHSSSTIQSPPPTVTIDPQPDSNLQEFPFTPSISLAEGIRRQFDTTGKHG